MDLEALAQAALRPALFLGWTVFGLAMFLRKGGAGAGAHAQRDAQGLIGFGIQFAGMTFVWWLQRPAAVPFIPGLPWSMALVAVAALAAVGAGLMWASMRALGKQWALEARTLIDHKLVTGGPYARVRHPIYTALLALLLATGLALSLPWATVLGIGVYLIGTLIRIRAEERVLRASFGTAYDDYARRVPALIPRL